MKRATILIFLLVVSTSNLSCCRGLRGWGNRGAPCQPQFAQPQFVQPQFAQPQFAQPQFVQPQFVQPQFVQPPVCPTPQAAPVIVCPPVECMPTTVCQPDPCLSMDYGSSTLVQPVPAPSQPTPDNFDGVYFPGDASSSLVYHTRPTLDQAVSPLQPLQSMSPTR